MRMQKSSSRGQVLVILAVGMIALVAMVGLAVDGSNSLSDRRHAQNAADTASLAGALAKITAAEAGSSYADVHASMTVAALDRAASNGYTNDLLNNTVEVYSPPVSGPYADCDSFLYECEDYVQVIIHSTVSTFFARVIGITELQNRVEATAYAREPYLGPPFGGNSIVSLKPTSSDCSGDFMFGGSGVVTLDGGGFFANSNNEVCAFVQDGCNATLVAVNGANIEAVGALNLNNNCLGNLQASMSTGADPYPFPPALTLAQPPECATAGTVVNDTATKTSTLSPGLYSRLPPTEAKGDIILLQSGNYCVQDFVKVTTSTSLMRGQDVFIYIMPGGSFSLQGGVVQVDAPNDGDYKGYVIYVAPYYNGVPENCVINGNNSNQFTGAIYAPYCDITINGTSSAYGYHSQIVGYEVKLNGGGNLNFVYDPDENPETFQPPETGLMR